MSIFKIAFLTLTTAFFHSCSTEQMKGGGSVFHARSSGYANEDGKGKQNGKGLSRKITNDVDIWSCYNGAPTDQVCFGLPVDSPCMKGNVLSRCVAEPDRRMNERGDAVCHCESGYDETPTPTPTPTSTPEPTTLPTFVAGDEVLWMCHNGPPIDLTCRGMPVDSFCAIAGGSTGRCIAEPDTRFDERGDAVCRCIAPTSTPSPTPVPTSVPSMGGTEETLWRCHNEAPIVPECRGLPVDSHCYVRGRLGRCVAEWRFDERGDADCRCQLNPAPLPTMVGPD